MKKIFLIIFLAIGLFLPSYSQEQLIHETYKINGQVQYNDNDIETIYLDDTIEKPRVNIPQQSLALPIGGLNITSNSNNTRSALARTAINRSSLGDILPLAGSVTETSHKFTYGSTWDEELSYSQFEATTSLFVKYSPNNRFSFMTSVRESANRDINSQYGSLRFTPELKITKNLTLKDSFTSYVSGQKNKNEVVIVYTPALKKYAEALKFELGLAQSYYSSGKQGSSVSFSTGFKL